MKEIKHEIMPEDTKVVCDCKEPTQAIMKSIIGDKEVYLCRDGALKIVKLLNEFIRKEVQNAR